MTTAAMLAICLLALVETTHTAEAKDSLPENGKIAIHRAHSGQGSIYTVEPDGSNVRLFIPSGGGAPKWSPDGTKILFGSGAGIAAMSADGSNLRNVTNASGYSPTWSADGTSVAFSERHLDMQQGQSRDNDIFMVGLDNSNKTTLRRTPKVRERFAAFSPDGSQICFTHFDIYIPGRKPSGIYVMDVHRSDPTLLFEDDIPGLCGWSPDGTKIVFSGDRDGGDYDIYAMDTDGSDVAQVTNLPGDECCPDWQPLTPKSRSLTVHQPDTGGTSL